MPRSRAAGPSKHTISNAWRLAVPLLAWSAMSACSSSFFQITPEEGAARPAPKPAVEKPAPKPAEKAPEKVAEKRPEKPREETKQPAVSKPQDQPAEKPTQVAKAEPRKAEPVKQNAPPKVAASTPPVAPPIVRRPEPVIEPPALEPTPAGSDSAGIARLMHAAALWDAVRLFHPGAVANPAAWDNATVRRLTDIRGATSNVEYVRAMRDWVSRLNDPVSYIDWDPGTETMSQATLGVQEVTTHTQIVVTGTKKNRVVDSTIIVKWPDYLDINDIRGWNDVQRALQQAGAQSQLVLDLRPMRQSVVRFANQGAVHDKPLEVASALSLMTVAGPAIRRRVFEGWSDEREGRTAQATVAWRVGEPLVVVRGAGTMRPRRLVIAASRYTDLPPALMALVSSKQATLISDAPLRDNMLVPTTRLFLGEHLSAVIRVGEVISPDGRIGIQPDTMVAPSPPASDSAMVLRTAILVARGKLQVGTPTPGEKAPTSYSPIDDGSRAAAWNSAHYPIMGARLLALFKSWATLRTFHAYNDLRDENIDDALYRLIPRVEAATDAYSYASAMLDFASSASDAQARLNSPTLEQHIGAASAPFAARSIEGRAIVTQIAATDAGRASGLAIGDEIVSADGYPMSAYVNEHRRYGAASNDWTRLRNTMDMIPRGAPGATTYRVRDANNRERAVSIERTADNFRKPMGIDRVSRSTARDVSTGFAYIDLALATKADLDRILSGLTGMRAFIVDARGTVDAPANETWPSALRMVLQRTIQTSNAVVGKEIIRLASEPCPPAESQMPSMSCVVDRRQSDNVVSTDTSLRYRGRVVVLIDERTEGVMEQFAMAMETAANATLIGSSSAGAVGAVTAMRLPGLMTLTFSSTELRRPDGGQIQRVGLTPQVETRPTVKGIRAGTDEVLERAQQWLKDQLDPQPVRRRR